MRKKVALIGLGAWGKNLLREFYKRSDVVAVCTTGNSANRDWLSENYPDIVHVTNVNKILADDSVEAVVIASPIDTHYKFANLSLKAGKHVFIEKPVSNNINNTHSLFKLSADKKLVFFPGYIYNFNPVLQYIQKNINKKEILCMLFEWDKHGTFNEDLTWNLLVHELYIIYKIFGQVGDIEIIGSFGCVTKCDVLSLRVNIGDCSILIHINRVSNIKHKKVSFRTKDEMLIWDHNSIYKYSKKLMAYKLIWETSEQPLAIEVEEFIKRVNSNNIDCDIIDAVTKVETVVHNINRIIYKI